LRHSLGIFDNSKPTPKLIVKPLEKTLKKSNSLDYIRRFKQSPKVSPTTSTHATPRICSPSIERPITPRYWLQNKKSSVSMLIHEEKFSGDFAAILLNSDDVDITKVATVDTTTQYGLLTAPLKSSKSSHVQSLRQAYEGSVSRSSVHPQIRPRANRNSSVGTFISKLTITITKFKNKIKISITSISFSNSESTSNSNE
jgi:hypothetical protein